MKISLHRFQITKRHALTISRGTSAGSENLLLEIEQDGLVGLGEMAPTSGGDREETAADAEAFFRQADGAFLRGLEEFAPWEMQAIEAAWRAAQTPAAPNRAAFAALDMALHDWIGKRLGVPVWRLFGLDPSRIVPTSVTVGINPPEVVRELVPEILGRTEASALKVKLGSPAGLEADRAIFAAAQEATTVPVAWRVDANGGWSVDGARAMLRWLAAREVEFVEQPLPRGQEADLRAVHHDSPLPIFVDESVQVASEIPRLAADVDGVNLKLMKCGGLRAAVQIIHTARAHGLKVMFGCHAETALSITAAAHLSPLADALDLDSHLNLRDDPFVGAAFIGGRVLPPDAPGLGVTRAV